MKSTKKSTVLAAAMLAALSLVSQLARAQSVAAKPASASDKTAAAANAAAARWQSGSGRKRRLGANLGSRLGGQKVR